MFFCFHKKLDFSGIEPDVRHFEEKFGKRVLVSCNDLSFNLQGCVAENEEGPTTNVCLIEKCTCQLDAHVFACLGTCFQHQTRPQLVKKITDSSVGPLDWPVSEVVMLAKKVVSTIATTHHALTPLWGLFPVITLQVLCLCGRRTPSTLSWETTAINSGTFSLSHSLTNGFV